SWMTSDGHRANILGAYKFFGTGYAHSVSSMYKHYWTQDFANGNGESCSLVSTTLLSSATHTPDVLLPQHSPADGNWVRRDIACASYLVEYLYLIPPWLGTGIAEIAVGRSIDFSGYSAIRIPPDLDAKRGILCRRPRWSDPDPDTVRVRLEAPCWEKCLLDITNRGSFCSGHTSGCRKARFLASEKANSWASWHHPRSRLTLPPTHCVVARDTEHCGFANWESYERNLHDAGTMSGSLPEDLAAGLAIAVREVLCPVVFVHTRDTVRVTSAEELVGAENVSSVTIGCHPR
ncbi:hypothetical protein PybrP1_000201, partial [[Pythium] brassicae (nom. inval.)]